ncbi:MAG: hypothetical protein HYV09_39180 [Deltaproteobacteria bacterium]|nr:hypothetical protein [Deltaproteobacteria bacterium]
MRWVLGAVVALTGCATTTCAGSTPTNNQAADSATLPETSEAVDSAAFDTEPSETVVIDANVPFSRCAFAVLSVASEMPRTWTSCGTGCAEMVAARAGYMGVQAGSAVGGVNEDRVYLRLESGRPGRIAVELIRVDDGSVRVATEADPACSLGARGSAFLLPFVDDAKLFLAYASAAKPTPTWHGAVVEFRLFAGSRAGAA